MTVPETDICGASLVAHEVCGGLEEKLVGKLRWASEQLSMSESTVEESTQLCLLIKACAEALKSVRDLDSEKLKAM